MIENLEVVQAVIVGRVRPHIYAFSTNTVPNYLKVGDTYRPVSRRIQEWRRYYPDLEQRFQASASVSDDTYFRDHAVHQFLMQDRGRLRLEPHEAGDVGYYSREFFGGADVADIEAALIDIQRDHRQGTGRYAFYDAASNLPAVHRYERGPEWSLRPNQQAAVNAFVDAVHAGRTNLLMYAVMRFGKTFTSLMCAKSVSARTVLVVSGKADVKGEWKYTVESAGNFEGYRFLDADALLLESDAITQAQADGKGAVVFLTLQDLQGAELKEKHAEVFGTEIDLLIVDETHFGARAVSYGQVLREAKQPVESEEVLEAEADDIAVEDAVGQLKVLHAKTKLHLSGSPYRILMGSEFAPNDIIAFVQFADIVREQEAWDCEHPDQNEWENPYFGFPQMIRFAFNLNESAQIKLASLKSQGFSYALSALLEPRSIGCNSTGLHKKFKHEAEILDLLRVIDGSQQDKNVLGFLDNDRIQAGEMCRHMVMVLPYRASCDAMESLIQKHVADFKNLGDYEVINISGVDNPSRFVTSEQVKVAIAEAASEGRKTLTLTVNRMLTGSTVEQWDTMLYLKDTASPQEYDQATFRLQSQYVRTLQSDLSGRIRIIKENLKPQTLLVDFDPLRLFQMQEQRSLMSNVAAVRGEGGSNGDLSRRLQDDLRISPVITINSGRLAEVEAVDILAAVSEYNLSRSIVDEARDLPVDFGLLEISAIRNVIEQQAEIGSRAGLTIPAVDGEETDFDLDENEDPDDDENRDTAIDDTDTGTGTKNSKDRSDDAADLRSLTLKLKTYYQRILFFAMLTPNPVASLKDLVDVVGTETNERIARNLGLDPVVLQAILSAFDPFKLNALDYKILNISRLGHEESLSPAERASRALEKFTRISDSEVRTPTWLCRAVVAQIPACRLKNLVERGEKILDVASKSGEFALACYERLIEIQVDPEVARAAIYSIPTSSIAYEFTRRFYEVLDLDVTQIASGFTSDDVLEAQEANMVISFDEIFEREEAMKFGAVVGNPPYQKSDGGAQQSARSIYPHFIAAAKSLEPEFMSFVIPSRWYAGGKSLGTFRAEMLSDRHISELHDFPKPETVFPETNNRGGVCYFLRDTNYDADAAGGTRIVTRDGQAVEFTDTRPLNTFDMDVFLRDSKGVEIVRRVRESRGFVSLENHVSSRKPFGLEGSIVRSPDFHKRPCGLSDPVRCYGKGRQVGYVERSLIRARTDWIDRWKVLTPYANNIGTELSDDNQNAFAVEPGSVCSETFIVIGADLGLAEETARNLVTYLKSKFARFLHAKAKVSQHGTKATYRFLPQVDLTEASPIDWTAPADAIDDRLFNLYKLTGEERAHIRASIKPMSTR